MVSALLLLVLLASPARADEVADVAAQASQAADAYCVDGASGDVQLAANTLIQVGGAWAEVDEAWQASHEPSLLYWRGRLAHCLDKEDRALADFDAFIAAMSGDPAYAQQVEDARRRMRFLYVRVGMPERAGPSTATIGGVVVGLGLGGAAGVLGGLAGWQDAAARQGLERYHSGELRTGDFPAAQSEIQQSGAAANALIGISAGLAVGSAVALVATAALSPRGRRTARTPGARRSARGGSALSLGPGGAGLEFRW